MVKDSNGIYHYTEGFMENGEPFHANFTYCGINWVNKHIENGGWALIYFLDAEIYEQDICELCLIEQERRMTDK